LPVAVEVLEVAASRVIVRLRCGGTEVGTEVLVGEYRRQVATPGVAVAAVKRPDLAARQQILAWRSEARRQRFGDDRAADAVAAKADRRDAGINAQLADTVGVEIREWWVHVVRTRGDQVHSIDRDAVAVVGQAADNRQA
jgi:hypothetical protein